jgi:hypothetical protein
VVTKADRNDKRLIFNIYTPVVSERAAEIILSSPWPETWDADVWYSALALLMAERAPA